MKYLALTLLLTGCHINSWEINQALEGCKEFGGVDYIKLGWVTCQDGVTFQLKAVVRK